MCGSRTSEVRRAVGFFLYVKQWNVVMGTNMETKTKIRKAENTGASEEKTCSGVYVNLRIPGFMRLPSSEKTPAKVG